jgi:hypothetical protein
MEEKNEREDSLSLAIGRAQGEAGETQVWLEYSVKCGYLPSTVGRKLHLTYDRIIGELVNMENNPGPWLLGRKSANP